MATKTAARKIAATSRKSRVKATTIRVINMAATTTKKSNSRTPAPTKKALDVFGEWSKTDVNGSYTGRPKDKREKPVQDADDL